MLSKFKKIKVRDIFAIFKFILVYPFTVFVNKKYKNRWLFCESGFEARDNAYWLFKYVRDNHKGINAIYVIDQTSPDYSKINRIGATVKHGSLKHWYYYLTASANISTHKGGKPNAAVCYILEVKLKMSNHRIFLQHGITLSNAIWLYYKNTNMDMFICGAKPEYDYISEKFGYPEGNVQYLGFSRFDSLIDQSSGNKAILIMPSWRSWLVKNPDQLSITDAEIEAFSKSKYYAEWKKALSSDLLKNYHDEGILVKFFPHRNIQPFLNLFMDIPWIEVCSWETYDIQAELKNCNLLITDYSSVSLDFSYMNKPVIYYQFDVEEFRENQYAEGYFDYSDAFGPLVTNIEDLEKSTIDIIESEFVIENKYTEKIDAFFELRDTNNSERIYEAIKEYTM